MLNLEETLSRNQELGDTINEIFNEQAGGNALFKDHVSFEKCLNCPKRIADSIIDNVKELSPSVILDNPYIKGLITQKASYKNWSLENIVLKANTLFTTDETVIDSKLNEITPLGYFSKDIEVPAVFENDRIWMSIVPHEIFTMQKAIDNSKGKVLAYGLGLGYFPLMAAIKEDVKEVVVVEKEQEPIDLYLKCIAPCFKESNKIKIVKMDAFKHASKVKDGEYDMIFADIWHDAEDGLELYSKFLKRFDGFKKSIVSYWIEETILTYARRILEILLIEKEEGATDEWYKEPQSQEDALINKIYWASKHRINQNELLSSNFVKSILRDM